MKTIAITTLVAGMVLTGSVAFAATVPTPNHHTAPVKPHTTVSKPVACTEEDASAPNQTFPCVWDDGTGYRLTYTDTKHYTVVDEMDN